VTADKTGASTYTSETGGGFEYTPQFWLQSYVSSENFIEASDGVVNQAVDGSVEVVRFGETRFMEAEIRFAMNVAPGLDTGPILPYTDGVEQLQRFMRYLITKGPVEFMPDTGNRAEFETFILESTVKDSKGLGFKLKERLDIAPGIFDTGVLTFRKVLT
jgi:hypothetical protein